MKIIDKREKRSNSAKNVVARIIDERKGNSTKNVVASIIDARKEQRIVEDYYYLGSNPVEAKALIDKWWSYFPKELQEKLYNLDITLEEAQQAGFLPWDDKLYVIPLWMVKKLNPELVVDGIFSRGILGKVDLDNRFGCIAYGKTFTEKEKND